ncbi:MAG: hypothetical protein CSB47_04465 [Proteobacteria bacterium]|nr:MAG: hypothetical protein CSB47_04465 [Pseudomonadota bacterium]
MATFLLLSGFTMTLSRHHLLLIILASALTGAFITHKTWQSSYPGRPLFVEFHNLRTETIPLITIEHGNASSQEKIVLTQMKPDEVRMVSLNHSPGQGYNVLVNLANGDEYNMCLGKGTDNWVNHVRIRDSGMYGGN